MMFNLEAVDDIGKISGRPAPTQANTLGYPIRALFSSFSVCKISLFTHDSVVFFTCASVVKTLLLLNILRSFANCLFKFESSLIHDRNCLCSRTQRLAP